MTMSPLRFLAALGLLGLGTLARGEPANNRHSSNYLTGDSPPPPQPPRPAPPSTTCKPRPAGRPRPLRCHPLPRACSLARWPGRASPPLPRPGPRPLQQPHLRRPGRRRPQPPARPGSISAAVTDAAGVQVSGSELTAEIYAVSPSSPRPSEPAPTSITDSATARGPLWLSPALAPPVLLWRRAPPPSASYASSPPPTTPARSARLLPRQHRGQHASGERRRTPASLTPRPTSASARTRSRSTPPPTASRPPRPGLSQSSRRRRRPGPLLPPAHPRRMDTRCPRGRSHPLLVGRRPPEARRFTGREIRRRQTSPSRDVPTRSWSSPPSATPASTTAESLWPLAHLRQPVAEWATDPSAPPRSGSWAAPSPPRPPTSARPTSPSASRAPTSSPAPTSKTRPSGSASGPPSRSLPKQAPRSSETAWPRIPAFSDVDVALRPRLPPSPP